MYWSSVPTKGRVELQISTR